MTLKITCGNFQSVEMGHKCIYIGLKRVIDYEKGTFTRNVICYFNAINPVLSLPKF